MSDRIRFLLVAILALIPASTNAMVTSGRIPNKSALVARVNLLYQALKNKDRDTFMSLIHPQALSCFRKSSPALFEPWGPDSKVTIASWEVRSIQARPNLRNEPLDNCDGEQLRGDATALVFVAHSGGPSAKGLAADDVSAKLWVHVDRVWYWVVSDCS